MLMDSLKDLDITEEQMQAFIDSLRKMPKGNRKLQPMPKIKPLVWVDVFRDDKHANVKAETTFGKFCITVVEPIGCYVSAAPFYNWPFKECKSEADAKDWCQAEYERRVRECLE